MGAAKKLERTPEETEVWYTAVRRGPIYCAPFCGFNCTWKAFQRATHLAHKLCMELGALWKPRVHENMGWHAGAVGLEGYAQVSVSMDGNIKGEGKVHGYHAFINQRGDGMPGGTWHAGGKTGEEALRLARESFDEDFRTMCKINEVLRRGII